MPPLQEVAMAHEAIRDIGGGWVVARDDRDGSLAVAREDDGRLALEGLRGPEWTRALATAAPEDIHAAVLLHMEHGFGADAALVLLRMLGTARQAAFRHGVAAGLDRARLERETAASPEFRLLRDAARRILGYTPVEVASCPWVVGVTPRVGNRANKAVVLYPFNVDRHAHGEIARGVEAGLHLRMAGEPDGLGNRRSHTWVLAPTATHGTAANSPRRIELLQDHFAAAMRAAVLETGPDGGLVRAAREADAGAGFHRGAGRP